jgi:rhamnogalacturonan endolyase
MMVCCCVAVVCVVAQPRYQKDRMQLERLNRGVVAVRNGQQVVVSWRTLSTDRTGEPFDVYRNGVKLNSKPLTQGGSFFVDEQPLAGDATYEVRGGGRDGSYLLKAGAPEGYVAVSLQKPADGMTPDGRTYTYSANDASVGDMDGDGQYEIVLKWDPSNAHDNAHDGFTGPTIFDCYKIVNGESPNSKLLWRIDMGINIRSGAHYVPFIVYDLDGDGRAEFIVRTADGTRDGKGRVIGDATADYRHRAPENAQNPTPEREWAKYNKQGRPKTGRILTGPEYLTVFNGMTGEAMDTKPYIPERGNLQDWGDDYANRSDRMLAAVGYLDGVHASAIFCRGYYTRTVLAAWDWDGRELKQHWVFDTNDEGTGKDGKPQQSYAGQGNHNLRVADVDGDGCDEITYGSMAVDHDGRGLYNTGMGHGDAIHLMTFDPTTDELQVWDCHENRRDGSDFRNARTGEVIFQIPSTSDVGRAMAADIDPTNPGVEMWSTDSHGIRNIKGNSLTPNPSPKGEGNLNSERVNESHDHEVTTPLPRRRGGGGEARLSINFGIWWDGDLLRELLDHGTVTKYNWETKTVDEVVRFPGIVFNNGSKSNPCLAADILGDWREEVVARTPDSSELRIFVSTVPTEHRINCLMEDIPYRLSTAAQNVGYNQPSEPGFYLGPDQSVTTFLK